MKNPTNQNRKCIHFTIIKSCNLETNIYGGSLEFGMPRSILISHANLDLGGGWELMTTGSALLFPNWVSSQETSSVWILWECLMSSGVCIVCEVGTFFSQAKSWHELHVLLFLQMPVDAGTNKVQMKPRCCTNTAILGTAD